MVDISDPSFDATKLGLTREAVNFHMHVLTPSGQVLKGVDAFAHIWSQLPRYRWASHVVMWPGIRALAGIGYEIFARSRHLLPKKKR